MQEIEKSRSELTMSSVTSWLASLRALPTYDSAFVKYMEPSCSKGDSEEPTRLRVTEGVRNSHTETIMVTSVHHLLIKTN